MFSIGNRKDGVCLQLDGQVSRQPERCHSPMVHGWPKGSSILLCFRFSIHNNRLRCYTYIIGIMVFTVGPLLSANTELNESLFNSVCSIQKFLSTLSKISGRKKNHIKNCSFLVGAGKKAVISKPETFSAALSCSYIFFTLVEFRAGEIPMLFFGPCLMSIRKSRPLSRIIKLLNCSSMG